MKNLMALRDDLLVIEDVISDLAAKQAWLSDYIVSHMDELSCSMVVRLLSLHGQNASRLGKLLRDQQALSGEASDGISLAIELAMEELSEILGTDLT